MAEGAEAVATGAEVAEGASIAAEVGEALLDVCEILCWLLL